MLPAGAGTSVDRFCLAALLMDPVTAPRWDDILSIFLANDSKYVITSPNMEWVPEPFVGLVQVHLRKDFRYGVEDPFQWPQVYSEGFEFLSAVLRRDGHRHQQAEQQ